MIIMKKFKKFSFLILIIYLIFFSPIFSIYLFGVVPHITGEFIKGQPRSRVKICNEANILRKKGAPSIEIARTLGTIGTKKIAVIIVDFSDQEFTELPQSNITFQKLKEYYNEVSYGKLQLDITFFHQNGSTKIITGQEIPFRMPKPMEYYGRDTDNTLAQLVKDAIKATNGTVDKRSYDYVMVLHAGYGNESTNNKEDIWSVYVDWDDAINGFTDGTIVPEKELYASAVGVVCHEFGHQLGLPDLYYGQESIVGRWCLMDYGVWNGEPQGSSPAHLSAWCKQFLGWLEVETVTSTKKNISLPYIERNSSAIKILIKTASNPQKEYFLLEYRRKIGFDAFLPAEGLLIWYIDDNIASDENRLKDNNINSGEPHYGVDLIEADMTPAGKDIENEGDPFPGDKNITQFFPQEYNITAYNGNPINMIISDIELDKNNAYFNIICFSGLYVKVTRLDAIPLNNVRIDLYKYKENISTYTYTSLQGSTAIELSTGIWSVTYSLQNYTTYYETIEIFPEQLIIKKVILRYDPSLVLSKNEFIVGNNYLDYTTLNKIVFRYNVEGPTDVKIIVYTISGNVIKTFEKYHEKEGYYEEIWDNVKDKNGNELPSGVYFVVFKSKYFSKVEKFIVKQKL